MCCIVGHGVHGTHKAVGHTLFRSHGFVRIIQLEPCINRLANFQLVKFYTITPIHNQFFYDRQYPLLLGISALLVQFVLS